LKYGVVLGEPKFGVGGEFAIDDPVAKLLSRYFTVSTSKRKMDHSLGELKGEVDHLGRDAAIEYLMMPERVKKLEGQVRAVASQLDDVRADLHDVVGALKALVPKPNAVPESPQLKDGGYIQ